MPMTRFWLLHAGIPAVLALLAWRCGAERLLPSKRPCTACHGEGKQLVRKMVFGLPEGCLRLFDIVTVPAGCDACSATGVAPVNVPFLASLLPQVVTGAWEFLCVALVAGLLWGLRTLDCPLCGGSGRLVLEASSPGEVSTVFETDCVRCEGQGRVHAFHRWTVRR